MKAIAFDSCGCFPTGRHYAGIAHLLKVIIRGIAEEFTADHAWDEIPIALLDVETTGVDASSARVIEVGIAVGKKGVVIARYNWLVNPGCPIPEDASAIHGIKDEDVASSPRFEQIAHEIRTALEGCVPAAYNAQFDRAFIHNEFARANVAPLPGAVSSPGLRREVDWLDPLVWARDIQSGERSRTLGDVAARLGVKLEQAHRASDDAEAALMVLFALGRDPRVPRSYGALVQEQRRLGLMQADERRRWKS